MSQFEVNATFQAEQSFSIDADTYDEAVEIAHEKAEELAGMNMSFDSVAVSYVEVTKEDD